MIKPIKNILLSSIFLGVVLTGCSNANNNNTQVPEDTAPVVDEIVTIDSPAVEETMPEEVEDVIDFEQVHMNIGVLRGPTGLGMLGVMDIDHEFYNIDLFGAPDEIAPQLIQGNLDFAAVPSNLASILYNNTNGAVQVVAINTLGVLHILDTTGEIQSISDLAGHTIFLSGLGAVPEFALNYVLRKNGLEPGVDVTLEFRAEHPEIAALMQSGAAQVALLPEPFATTVYNSVEDAQFALDLTTEWEKVAPDYSNLIMGVLVARREFLEAHPEATAAFLSDYENSINLVNADVPFAAELAAQFDIIPNAAIAEAAIPRSNIVFITGTQMESALTGFLSVLYDELPQSIGGTMPEADFFYMSN